MKTDVTEVAPCRKKIRVEVPAETVDQTFDETYKSLAENVQIKGFRKGRAPRRVLERRFSQDVGRDVRDRLVNESFQKAMEENDLAPMGDPDLEVESLTVAPGEAFSFETEVDVRPQFEMPEYKNLPLTEQVRIVTDENVDEYMENLRGRFTTPLPVEEPWKSGDVLEAGVQVTAGDETLVEEESARVRPSDGVLFGIPVEDLESRVEGIEAGQKREFTLPLPETYHDEKMRGKEASITIEAKTVLRPEAPELDDAFAKRLGLEDMEALRKQIRETLEAQEAREARERTERALTDRLIEATSFDLPEAFMKRQLENALAGTRARMARMGATQDFLDERADEMRESTEKELERNVRRSILLDAVAEKEGIELSEQEVQTHIQMLAQEYQTTPAAMFKRIQEMNGLQSMLAEMRDAKVARFLLDNADITEEKVESLPEDDAQEEEAPSAAE